MTFSRKLGLATCLIGLGIVGHSAFATATSDDNTNDICIITAETSTNSLSLSGVAKGKSGTTGHYRFSISGGGSGGSTSISQGGEFKIGKNGKASVGNAVLGRDAVYDVSLEIKIGNKTHRCSDRIGDQI